MSDYFMPEDFGQELHRGETTKPLSHDTEQTYLDTPTEQPCYFCYRGTTIRVVRTRPDGTDYRFPCCPSCGWLYRLGA